MAIRTQILMDKANRAKLLQLVGGLLIGLEIKDKDGRRWCLSDNLRLCYIGIDQHDNEHLLAVWTEGYFDLVHLERLIENVSQDEWSAFVSNIGLNYIHGK